MIDDSIDDCPFADSTADCRFDCRDANSIADCKFRCAIPLIQLAIRPGITTRRRHRPSATVDCQCNRQYSIVNPNLQSSIVNPNLQSAIFNRQ
jgi:hypothetical protein